MLQRKLILEGKISKVIVKMAIPSVIMQLVMLIYNTADTYFVSQINKSAAAAVGTVFSIQSIIQAVGFGFGMGASSLCSRKLGEAKDDDANRYAVSAIFGAVVIAAAIGVFGLLLLNPILRGIGCTDTMLPHARAYSMVILTFAPVSCASFVIGNIFKAEGHMKMSMYGFVSGTLINLIMDPVFIFILGLGTFGAALSTVLSQVISICMYSYFFIKGKTVIELKLRNISRSLDAYYQIVTTGIPTFFRQGLGSLSMMLLCNQGANYGDAAVAAVTISNKCYMLIRNVVLGIGQGAQPVAGYNYGAGKYRRAKKSYDFAMLLGTIICLVSSVIIFIFAKDIMWWFCKDNEVLIYGVPALKYASMVIPVMAVSTYVNQEYQCLGFKKQATFLASCRQGICFVPTIFILPYLLGATGVEMAQPVSDFLTFIISIPFYFSMAKKLSKDIDN